LPRQIEIDSVLRDVESVFRIVPFVHTIC
jgi:hypothetical protein